MFKYLLFIFLIFFLCNPVIGETIYLPQIENTNISNYILLYNESNNYITNLDNEIYSIENRYRFGLDNVVEGTHIYNTSFKINNVNTTISEKFNITSETTLFLFKKQKIQYELSMYENNILKSQKFNEYYVSTTAVTFVLSKYIFIDDEIKIIHKYATTKAYITKEYTIDINRLILQNVNITNNFEGNCISNIYITYIKLGERPKAYYTDQLPPSLNLIYKVIQGIDKNNNILNIFLISSYILKTLFFWLKVIYASMFTLLIIFLIGVIPFISLSQSNNPNEFINKLFYNYGYFFNLMINIVKYVVNMAINLINLIPFI